jgi:hypothetical protein
MEFTVPGLCVSGLDVKRITLAREAYKMFKGVKHTTIQGTYEVR